MRSAIRINLDIAVNSVSDDNHIQLSSSPLQDPNDPSSVHCNFRPLPPIDEQFSSAYCHPTANGAGEPKIGARVDHREAERRRR